MRKLSLYLGFTIILSSQVINAQDIFKQHGFDKKPLTLSNGRYNEFFNNDKIVQIGTVLLNTQTNKIIAFLEEDTAKAIYLPEFSSRWLSPDPLAAKYPEISPYVYVTNNPIIKIDPNGEDWYQAENGNAMWRRSSDKEYTDANGNLYKNIGTQYISVSGTSITLFQQKTNDEGEMYLRSTTFDTKGNVSVDKVLGVLAIQNSDESREAAMKNWANPTFNNHFKYLFTELLSQYKNPYLVLGGLSAGVAGLSALSELGESSLNYAPRVRARGVEDQ